ncbi:MAG: UDP-N-acetylenolpyruvoylglucosamine reductase [Berkelbacteria bacterium GW2011_GWA2_35_9]|uniref:UDP-N-acetylenolpyruvoylglucosamine reductase n=1 Tax=Berkelbacteria bacterium GW2011_GWA2_35_9 TaxID=1618333 RepID=A0A0G0FNQ8_9BACT|nr:MAG: UDP-N-acetylenolpyruvoylglucosamine reductase [Berkelbacteria bacterium GW2011_GWA2_35_9]
MDIQKNISLKPYTTFNVGGPAKYFCKVQNVDELKKALGFAQEKKIEYFILAGGSNIIVSDKGYDGLVIKPDLQSILIKDNIITVGVSFEIDKLVDITNDKGLKGLEWAGGLPGTVGGAVRGNAGAFGGEIKDCVLQAKSLKLKVKNYELRTLNNIDCQFGYRESIFKYNHEIILEVTLQLQKGDPKLLKEKSKFTRNYRKEKHPINYPCAGSIFKNLPTAATTPGVVERFKNVIKNDPFPVIPTAAVIDRMGLKGHQIGGAQISEKHPNYIVNLGDAKAQDIVDLIEYTVKITKSKYNINLEIEPQLLGFDKPQN